MQSIVDVGRAYYRLGVLFQNKGELETAEGYYNKALEITESQLMENAQAFTLYGLAQVEITRGQFPKARQFLYEAEITADFPPGYMAELIKARIRVYLGLKRFDQLPRLIGRVNEIYASFNYVSPTYAQLEVLELTALWKAAEGDFEQAHSLMRQYHAQYAKRLRMQLQEQQQALYQEVVSENERLQRAMLVREADKARERASAAIEKASVFEEQFRSQQAWLYFAIGGVVLLAGGLSWLWMSRRRMYRQASLDPLTQLANRGHALSTGRKMFLRSELKEHPLVVLRFSLDHFALPQVARADELEADLLRQVSENAARILRRGELLAYISDNDFLVLLPDLHVSKGFSVAQRIRSAISNQQISAAGVELNVTASVGIAERERDGAGSIEQLMGQAKEALSMAQQQGSDSVCYYVAHD